MFLRDNFVGKDGVEVLLVNLDMIGRLRKDSLEVGGIIISIGSPHTGDDAAIQIDLPLRQAQIAALLGTQTRGTLRVVSPGVRRSLWLSFSARRCASRRGRAASEASRATATSASSTTPVGS